MKLMMLALAVAFGLGCSSGDPTRFYVLNPVDPGPALVRDAAPKAPLCVEIGSLRVPYYLERPYLVTRRSSSQLDLAQFHQWGGNLRKDMLLAMAKNLTQLLNTPHVSISPAPPQIPLDFRIDLEVTRFERDSDGRVRLSARWSLTAGKDQRLLVARISELESPPVEGAKDMEPTVTAMSLLWGELSQTIARDLWRHASERPAS
jgi:hypothetical protein